MSDNTLSQVLGLPAAPFVFVSFSRKLKLSAFAVNRGLNMPFHGSLEPFWIIIGERLLHWDGK